MTTLPTLSFSSFSADNAFANLLNRVVVLLLGTPPVVVRLSKVVVFAMNAATAAPARMTIQGGCYGRA